MTSAEEIDKKILIVSKQIEANVVKMRRIKEESGRHIVRTKRFMAKYRQFIIVGDRLNEEADRIKEEIKQAMSEAGLLRAKLHRLEKMRAELQKSEK